MLPDSLTTLLLCFATLFYQQHGKALLPRLPSFAARVGALRRGSTAITMCYVCFCLFVLLVVSLSLSPCVRVCKASSLSLSFSLSSFWLSYRTTDSVVDTIRVMLSHPFLPLFPFSLPPRPYLYPLQPSLPDFFSFYYYFRSTQEEEKTKNEEKFSPSVSPSVFTGLFTFHVMCFSRQVFCRQHTVQRIPYMPRYAKLIL